jgi:sialic acid synthase SpsE
MKKKLTIIAEAAQGYEGDFIKAKLLIKAASITGANAIKFQMVYADELATPDYKYYDLFKSLEFSENKWNELKLYSDSLGIELYLDIFGSKSLKISQRIGTNCVKLHPTDITNIAFLEMIKNSKISHVILGVGGAFLNEILNALEIIEEKKVTLLFGFQGYPTLTADNQISRISFIRNKISNLYPNVDFGFADHENPDNKLAFCISSTAIGTGIQLIEKHITISKNLKMEDYESALNPDDFEEFVKLMHNCYESLGRTSIADDFNMSNSEKIYRKNIRRHVVAVKDIKKNTILTPELLCLKRTSSENSITDIKDILNKKVNKGIKINTSINDNDI